MDGGGSGGRDEKGKGRPRSRRRLRNDRGVSGSSEDGSPPICSRPRGVLAGAKESEEGEVGFPLPPSLLDVAARTLIGSHVGRIGRRSPMKREAASHG
jgi:hypothetical protein